MKNPIGLLVAIVFTTWGVAAIFFPQWFYRTVTPDQAERDRKRTKRIGFLFLPLGLVMLAAWFLMKR